MVLSLRRRSTSEGDASAADDRSQSDDHLRAVKVLETGLLCRFEAIESIARCAEIAQRTLTRSDAVVLSGPKRQPRSVSRVLVTPLLLAVMAGVE